MRLWSQQIIHQLPRQQLLGQHRECCALRGKGWRRPHSVVNYVFTYSPEYLVAYHYLIIDEMKNRGYNPDPIWTNPNYRGKELGVQENWCKENLIQTIYQHAIDKNILIYSEHDEKYLQECLDNLKQKGIELFK